MRSDALRNRARILDAAREQMAEHGSETGMDQIAQAAGVAVGTLYRHFPTKRDLVQAVMTEFMQTLVERGESAAATLQPGDAINRITDIIRSFTEEAAKNEAIKEAATALDAAYFSDDMRDRARAAMAALVDAAAADGDLRPDVSADDIFLLMTTAPHAAPRPARDRWLDIVTTGIRST
jgi:AcrR family transcriptional regulator